MIVVSPTGSGKTWVQGLIAKYLCEQGQRVIIVEPNEQLRLQTAEKLAAVDYGINVTSIEAFYLEVSKHDVILLNEYDLVINQHPYHVQKGVARGLWQLHGRKVIAFTATSSVHYERFVNNCIAKPLSLRFKSEYELAHGASPVSDAAVIACAG